MLNLEDNKLLTQVGPGTPGGEVLRHYWLPFLISEELPAPDCAPLRVRLLSEDLVVFRDTDNRVGLFADHCPHRGASMFFGRNEESGLRCVYHGWKFDVTGACVDMPSEPAESNFRAKVRATAYPCRELNGVVWTYMGREEVPPPLPELESNLLRYRPYVSKRLQYCNWFQALEGGIDSSHVNFLHSSLRSDRSALLMRDAHPYFETLDTNYGVLIAARREAEDDKYYWRLNHYAMPFHTIFPSGNAAPDALINFYSWVPIDDERTIVMRWNYYRARPFTDDEVATLRNSETGFNLGSRMLLPPSSEPFGAWRPSANRANDYLLDQELQRTTQFSGIPFSWAQDAGMQESMGAVTNRLGEHLGVSDRGVIAARRYFLNAVKAYKEAGTTPPAAHDPAAFRLKAAVGVLPHGVDWLPPLRDALSIPPDPPAADAPMLEVR